MLTEWRHALCKQTERAQKRGSCALECKPDAQEKELSVQIGDAGSEDTADKHPVRVIVLGAGGLGCEILRLLPLMGFFDIDVIDLDTIQNSNLNRQSLFDVNDIDKPKAIVAAEKIRKRFPQSTITAHVCALEAKNHEFYRDFRIVISALDSIASRRWINSVLLENTDLNKPETLSVFIDGGTEGLCGQVRVIIPHVSACFECTLDLYLPAQTFPFCTIANTPRLPEHCIEWARMMQWPSTFEEEFDADNLQHVDWVYKQAHARAKEFKIQGVTMQLTLGVVKNIIPSVASTNAFIAGVCCMETLKIVTQTNFLQNYLMYNGQAGIYTYKFEHHKKPDCLACGISNHHYYAPENELLGDFIEKLSADKHLESLSVSTDSNILFMQTPNELCQLFKTNLYKQMTLLVSDKQKIYITSKSILSTMTLTYHFAN